MPECPPQRRPGHRQVWMLGTSPAGKGGVAAMLRQYDEAGLFADGAVRLIETHHDRSRAGRVLPFLKACLRLWPALALGRVSAIHAHVSHGGSFWRKLLLTLPANAAGVPVLVHLHSGAMGQFHDEGSPLRRAAIRLMLRRAFRVLTLSSERADWVRRIEPAAQADVLVNSFALPPGEPATATLGATPTVLFLGRIGPSKGTFELLAAFADLLPQLPAARLVIGGDGDSERLLAEIQALGVAHAVRFAGWVGSADKHRLLRSAWLFALPSHHEGLPMSILEAMAHGRAVVSCPVGGIPEAVEPGRTGLLLPPGDVPRLKQALLELLSDRSRCEALGAAGRASFDAKFSNAANLPRLVRHYAEAGASPLPALDNPSRGLSTT